MNVKRVISMQSRRPRNRLGCCSAQLHPRTEHGGRSSHGKGRRESTERRGAAAYLRRVFAFSDFTADNDPYGEHDFGSFEFAGKTIFWKIDAYDRDLANGSPDPSDPSVTTRVLTVLLAEEY